MRRSAKRLPRPGFKRWTRWPGRLNARSLRSIPIWCSSAWSGPRAHGMRRTVPVMRARREPSFWWRPPGLISGLLSPLAAAYGAVAAWRMAQPGRAAAIPIVCVGNLTLGGAGKTPAAIAVAQILAGAGRRPFVLSRGYGGALAGPVGVDPAHHRAADVGDEPLLLARFAPAI